MNTCDTCAATLADAEAERAHAKWHRDLREALQDVLIAANNGHRGFALASKVNKV